MKYDCRDVCMIRRPSLSINDFRNWDESKYGKEDVLVFLEEHDISSYFTEALMISSPDLFKAMERLGQNIKNDKETYLSIVEYLIRSTTRPTPYGMLAQVVLSKLEKEIER